MIFDIELCTKKFKEYDIISKFNIFINVILKIEKFF